MSNRWDQPGVPHKGWNCVDVVDLRGDGESAEETDYATCQMCGNEKIRYVHIMEHPDLEDHFDVGCVRRKNEWRQHRPQGARKPVKEPSCSQNPLADAYVENFSQREQLPKCRRPQSRGTPDQDKAMGVSNGQPVWCKNLCHQGRSQIGTLRRFLDSNTGRRPPVVRRLNQHTKEIDPRNLS